MTLAHSLGSARVRPCPCVLSVTFLFLVNDNSIAITYFTKHSICFINVGVNVVEYSVCALVLLYVVCQML